MEKTPRSRGPQFVLSAVLSVLVAAPAFALDAQSIAGNIGNVLPGYRLPGALPSVKGADVRPAKRAAPAASSSQLITEPEDGRGPVLDAINGAGSSIQLTIYEINDPQIVQALIAAQGRGVSVQILYNHYSFAHYGHDPNAQSIAQLQAAGVQVEAAPKNFTVTHQKTLVVDGQKAIIMTFNLCPTYFGKSRDFGYVTSDPAAVSEIQSVFSADWNGTSYTPSQSSLVWSPSNSREKITDLINGATRTLDIDNEELRDSKILDAISAAAARGVAVRVLCAALKGSGGQDGNQAGRDKLNAAGAQAKVGAGLYMHAKMVLADRGTSSAAAYIGSENFSQTSLDKNRELGVIITDPAKLSSLEGSFQQDWDR